MPERLGLGRVLRLAGGEGAAAVPVAHLGGVVGHGGGVAVELEQQQGGVGLAARVGRREDLAAVAPLGRSEGAIRGCAQATYSSPDDADYQAVLKAVQAAAKRTWEEPRRDVAELQNK